MTRRAVFSPGTWKETVALLLAVGCLVIMPGCGGGGGGGGGGGTRGVCGSQSGSSVPILCGNVFRDGTTSGVANATVRLKNAAGQEIASAPTDSSGFFIFNNVSQNAVLFQVDPPQTGFNQQTARYKGQLYAYYIQNQANSGSCIMAVDGVTAGDRQLDSVYLFPDSSPPPAPASGCPR